MTGTTRAPSERRARARSLRWWVGVAMALGLVAAACGNDSDDAGDEAAATDGEEAVEAADAADEGDPDADAESVSADIEAACEAGIEAEAAAFALEDVGEEGPDAVQAHARDELLPPAQRVADNAPAEIAAETQLLADAVSELSETGDFAALDTPEVQDAYLATQQFMFDTCEGEKVEVDLVNFAFVGAPDALPAGEPIYLKGTNSEASELHEIVLMKRNPGTDEPVEELLALDDEEAFAKLTPAVFAFAEPGEEFITTAMLEPGEYVMACFIPEGATFEDLDALFAGEADPESLGTPHWEHGMVHELTVE